jgi:hypothetical protein
MVGDQTLSDDVIDDIVERTDGAPLFVEELTKSVTQTGLTAEDLKKAITATPSLALSVPATLHAPLMARLDGLGTAKDIAQIGSGIGREFSFELLSAVAERPSNELQAGLNKLVEAGLVFQRGTLPHATFLFKHALIQDAAYGTLLRGPRQRLHARIAEVLAGRFPEIAVALPEVLAQHYSNAALTKQAVTSWQDAGERAISRSAIEEAIVHFTNGLDAIAHLAETRKRRELELDLRLCLAGALISPKGWMAPEVQEQLALARNLAERLGDQERLFRSLYGPFAHSHTVAKHDLALTAARVLSVAEHHVSAMIKSVAHCCMGMTTSLRGEFAISREQLERSLALDRPHHAQAVIAFVGYDHGVLALNGLARTLAILGYVGEGIKCAEKAIERGKLLRHAQTMAQAQYGQMMPRWISTTRNWLIKRLGFHITHSDHRQVDPHPFHQRLKGIVALAAISAAEEPNQTRTAESHAQDASSSSKVLACFKSSVSKPSVNQP